jgi:putative phosphoesterase
MRIGVISDTHGYLNRRVLTHFAGVEQIIHAGDIGREYILDALAEIAPVTAVTGNVDWGTELDRAYRRVARLEIGGYRIYVTHIGDDPARLVARLPEPRPQIYIYGHSHIAHIERRDGVLFLNPGAAAQPRFGRQPSVAILELGTTPEARLIEL